MNTEPVFPKILPMYFISMMGLIFSVILCGAALLPWRGWSYWMPYGLALLIHGIIFYIPTFRTFLVEEKAFLVKWMPPVVFMLSTGFALMTLVGWVFYSELLATGADPRRIWTFGSLSVLLPVGTVLWWWRHQTQTSHGLFALNVFTLMMISAVPLLPRQMMTVSLLLMQVLSLLMIAAALTFLSAQPTQWYHRSRLLQHSHRPAQIISAVTVSGILATLVFQYYSASSGGVIAHGLWFIGIACVSWIGGWLCLHARLNAILDHGTVEVPA